MVYRFGSNFLPASPKAGAQTFKKRIEYPLLKLRGKYAFKNPSD